MTVRNIFFCSDVIVCSEADRFKVRLEHLSTSFRRDELISCLLTIHVSNFGVLESLGKLGPSLVRDVVRLTDVQAPNAAFGCLQNAK